MIHFTVIEYWGIFTPLLLALLALSGLVLDMSVWKDRPRPLGVFTLAGILTVLFLQAVLQTYRLNASVTPGIGFGGEFYFDMFSAFFNYIFLIAAAATVLMSLTHYAGREDHRGEHYLLLVIATIGMCLMAGASDFLILFLGLETMSIPVYILAGGERRRLRSNEASIKYLLLGAFASAILLYGMALVYGTTGSINYNQIGKALPAIMAHHNLGVYLTFLFGALMVVAGFSFKVAAVPFHMWTPDVYEGAPTPVTAYMATAVKAAAFAGLLRLLIYGFTALWGEVTLYPAFYALAVLTMTLGNFVAIAQKNLKRMLAYSSIAHAGYLLVGVTALVASGQFQHLLPGPEGQANMLARGLSSSSAVLFYLLAYTFMNLGAFGVIMLVAREKEKGETLEGFAGLARRRPGLAAVMAVCMFSLAGVPPFVGFAAKFYIFQSAISCRLYVLAIIGVLNSVVSAYYYLRVLVVMYMEEEKVPMPGPAPRVTGAVAANVLMALVVVLMGVFPQPVLDLVGKVFSPDMMALLNK